jgi:hypothetical protein
MNLIKTIYIRVFRHRGKYACLCLFIVGSFFLLKTDCTAQQILADTERKMKTDGFWIGIHPCPDKIIMTGKEIVCLNAHIENDLKLTRDITQLPPSISGTELASSLQALLDRYRKRRLFFRNGLPANAAFYERIRINMNFERILPQMPVQYGITTQMTNQRCLPTMENLHTKGLNFNLDMLQDNSFDMGTPVAVVHASADGEWYYVIDKHNNGWVKADRVALCDVNELKEFLSPVRFAVVIKAKVSVYLNANLTKYCDYVRMGTRLPLYGNLGATVLQVGIPFRKADGRLSMGVGYISASGVHEGYLLYTARTIIERAFELINTPYEWGGLNGEQDCSQFIQEIFATVGLALPRNSFKQAQTGILLDQFPGETPNRVKVESLARKATGGITLLYMKGHIMLFLGTVDNCPYAIHNTCSYSEGKTLQGTRVQIINNVAVTSLFWGKETQKGSYIERLLMVMAICGPL